MMLMQRVMALMMVRQALRVVAMSDNMKVTETKMKDHADDSEDRDDSREESKE